jgi:cell division protein FtsB
VAVSSTAVRRYRPRIAPRKRRGRSSRSRIRWDKVGRVALVLVLFAVLVSYVRPVVNLLDTWRESRSAEARLGELQAEKERLQRRANQLKTPAATLREARKLGLVGPGEQAYVVKGLK